MNAYLEPYGGDYFSFVLIGIAFSGFLQTGLSTFSSSISSAQSQGTLEAMLVTPTRLSAIIIFSSFWSFLFTSLNVLVYLAFGALIFGMDLSNTNVGASLLILALTIVAFSGVGIISASFIMVLKRGDPISWVFGSVSGLLGGTYFPVTILPAWLQNFSYIFPLFYALRGMRHAMLQNYTLAQLAPDIIALALFAVAITPLSIAAFKFAVKRAKIDGNLVTY
ncbi:MAG: ABC transporter permease [Terriglobia bacterium]